MQNLKCLGWFSFRTSSMQIPNVWHTDKYSHWRELKISFAHFLPLFAVVSFDVGGLWTV